MASTPAGGLDPSHIGRESMGIAPSQDAHHDTADGPALGLEGPPEALPRQPADAAEPVEKAASLAGPAGGSSSRRERRQRRSRRWLLAAGGVVIVTLGVGLWLAVTVLSATSPTGPGTAGDAATFLPYRDPQGRFSLSYPSLWQQEPASGSQAALLLRAAPGSQNSMLVRIVPLDEPVGPEQLAEAKKLTDSLVQASDVNIVVVRQITLSGVPGYYYLYTFGEPGSNRFGLHAHYFLFSGPTMHVLVFQALPDTEFVALAPDFDAIARSYRVS